MTQVPRLPAKRVLVSGASGVVGRHSLHPLLERGYAVHAVSSHEPPPAADDVAWHRVDLLDHTATAALIAAVEPTHLLHFAWFTNPESVYTSIENVRWVEASLALLREFAGRGGQRAVVAGTCVEYALDTGVCIEGRTPCEPTTLYGAAKSALQLLTSKLCLQLHLSLGWGRLFSLFGPGEHEARLVPYVTRMLLAQNVAACSHGTQIRDFLYSEDAGSAFVALLDSAVEGPVNIASGRPLAVRDLVSQLGDVLGARHLIRFGESGLRPGEPGRVTADVTRLTNEVGWQPQFTLRAGLERTVEWWRHRLAAVR